MARMIRATMPILRWTVLIACAAVVAGCAASAARWNKAGVSEAQRKSDIRYCRHRAGDYDFLRPGRRASARTGARSRGESYRWCMEKLGYSRGGTGKAK